MPEKEYRIQILHLQKMMDAFHRAPVMFNRHVIEGMKMAMNEVVETEGVKIYPPPTAANQPPPPYYKRGVGRVLRSGKTLGTSERYGTQFYTKGMARGPSLIRGIAGNRASYGVFVGGDLQPDHMARKGWVKLIDAARENLDNVRRILEFSVDKALRKLDLL